MSTPVYSHTLESFGTAGTDWKLTLLKNGQDVGGGVVRERAGADPYREASEYALQWEALNRWLDQLPSA